jgi:hypothetical protein
MATREEKIAAKKLTYKGFKSHLTRKINSATRAMALAETDEASTVLLETLKTHLDDVKSAYNNAENALRKLQNMDAPSWDDYESKLGEDAARTDTCGTDLLRWVAIVERQLRPPPPAGGGGGGGGGGGPPPKANEALKPKTLTRDFTPVEVTKWARQFEAYFTSSRMGQCSAAEQQAYFRACIDAYIESRISDRILPGTPVLATDDDDGCIGLIHEEFLLKYPIFARRLDFFRYKQSRGQLFSDWAQELRKKMMSPPSST